MQMAWTLFRLIRRRMPRTPTRFLVGEGGSAAGWHSGKAPTGATHFVPHCQPMTSPSDTIVSVLGAPFIAILVAGIRVNYTEKAIQIFWLTFAFTSAPSRQLLPSNAMDSAFNVVEASLVDIQVALRSGAITSVHLTVEYLRRISAYDCRGPCLNSIPIINPHVFEEAAASDDRRAAGTSLGPLDGIPYTVKDSYKVKGLTVANGAPAFAKLVADTDAFTVSALRKAGAVLIGKTNMPPMAAGGMQRGVYGRAESPYNSKYLAAAFASGSSNGSAVSTGASLAAFGLGEETVSSGRSPASNNAVVAYTPSRGNISIRGNWPLYSLCDVVVPHTRSVDDLFSLLDVIAQPDPVTKGDFWRHQELIALPRPWLDRPSSFCSLSDGPSFETLKIAAPVMYTQGDNNVYVSDAVRALWRCAKRDLESIGAEVVCVPDFPVVTEYEASAHIGSEDKLHMPKNWKQVERAQLPALAWQEFLQDNNDANLMSLRDVDPNLIWPYRDKSDPQVRFSNPENAVHWDQLSDYVAELAAQNPPITSQYQISGLKEAVTAVEELRKSLLEDWMAENNVDFVVFPAAGDIGRADADVSVESAAHAWTNGIKYSNGNQALRHLGVPSVTVPMGVMADKSMPVGLTIIGKAYDDVKILRLGYLYEQASKRRTAPPLTPSLPSIFKSVSASPRPYLQVGKCKATSRSGTLEVEISATVTATSLPLVQVYVDGCLISADKIQVNSEADTHTVSGVLDVPAPPRISDKLHGDAARDKTMVMILASVGGGRPSAWLKLLN